MTPVSRLMVELLFVLPGALPRLGFPTPFVPITFSNLSASPAPEA